LLMYSKSITHAGGFVNAKGAFWNSVYYFNI